MRAWFQRFMMGRYGGDSFNRFLCGASLALFVVNLLFAWRLAYIVGLALLVYSFYRMFSRQIDRRRAEEVWYQRQCSAAAQKAGQLRQRISLRRTYRYFRCPHCGQQLRVPRGRGRISINCPKCGTQFIKKS